MENDISAKIRELYGVPIIPERKKFDFEIMQKSWSMDNPERMENFYKQAEAEYRLYKTGQFWNDLGYIPFIIGMLLALIAVLIFI